MTAIRDDDTMREAFQSLRAETQRGGSVPDFGAVLEEARRQAGSQPALEVLGGARAPAGGRRPGRRLARLGGWAASALAAGVATLLLLNPSGGPRGDADFERLVAGYVNETASGVWTSPTSGLLEVPGMDLMRSMPSIGRSLRGIDPSTLPTSRSTAEEENL